MTLLVSFARKADYKYVSPTPPINPVRNRLLFVDINILRYCNIQSQNITERSSIATKKLISILFFIHTRETKKLIKIPVQRAHIGKT